MDSLFKMFIKMNGGENAGVREVRQPKFSPTVRVIISLVITAVLGFAVFYVALPPLNIHSIYSYIFVVFLAAVFAISMQLLNHYVAPVNKSGAKIKFFYKKQPVPAVLITVAVIAVVVGGLMSAEFIRADDYAKLISTEEGDFTADVAEIDWEQIPMLDSDSANKLANRKLGELSDLVSQFVVSEKSAQINYNNRPVRVTYLDYSDFFKWFSNQKEGIPAYMTIDMCTQEVNVVRLDEGIKYSPSEYFNRNLNRYLRFKYPTLIFDDVNFEVNEEGTPYWVASVLDKKIGLFGGDDVIGAVLVNAVTGETEYMPVGDIPAWVDRVYSSDLLIAQYDYKGLYVNGFLNSMFDQSGCTATTDGYNYVVLEDDVWMYTGITSVTTDEGNIGFILVNQRTKEAKYYSCAGAEEYSAMSSAEGAVQQYSYNSTFPLLLNVSDQPTYFMSLKDSAGLVKMYAMVNVKQYQIVATGYTLEECRNNYHDLLVKNKLVSEEVPEVPEDDLKTEKTSGVIAEIRSADIDGNTVFYLKLEGGEVYYTVSAKDYPIAAVLNVGDKITLEYVPAEGVLISVSALTID